MEDINHNLSGYTDMKKLLQRLLAAAIVLAIILLGVGYVRLPMSALRELSDYEVLDNKPLLHTTPEQFHVSTLQEWWLERRLDNLSPGNSPPRIFVRVRWNYGVLARVHCGHYISATNAEKRESLYMWFLGMWLRLYDYNHMRGEISTGDRQPSHTKTRQATDDLR